MQKLRLAAIALVLCLLSMPAAYAVDPTSLTVQTLKNLYAGNPGAGTLDITFAACDAVNGNRWAAAEKDILLVLNSDGANPYTFTLSSVADKYGRTGDITTYSMAAGDYVMIEVPSAGFRQTNGYVNVTGSNAAIKFAVLRRP